MSHEVLVQNEERSAAVTESPAKELLDKVVESVRGDSRHAAAQYLADTTVPHGGE